ncbi:hypothetical protein [Pantoea trifolii]|uniref:DUF4375 domain-containing protein n=1 Tax=Pantoea trifolii TaxID=2968030 RepID=A0ABT1VS91_9GAMM|nr:MULTISPECIES: hypothetical protein [unclassified Pantoea]MCQ8230412.1 hypothetical protein [Pantoea sp. MMK2]MCQ8239155.1 hypothetical protein [Pantoea sp. MMK3]
MSFKKKSGKKVSGDPRKRSATAVKKTRVKKTREERTLKLHEFIDMENPRDVKNLREEAIEEKSIDMAEMFWDWYGEKTGAYNASNSILSSSVLDFFDALFEFGKVDHDSGQLNYDDIISYLKDPANTLEHMEAKWDDLDEEYLLSYLKEFLKVNGYLADLHGFLSLDAYIEKVLDFEYSFYDDEPAVFSYPEK